MAALMPEPLYHPTVEDAAYALRYSWTGWPSGKAFTAQPIDLIPQIKPLWENDGLRVLEYRWTEERVQILFEATPEITPIFLAARAKGRLDHALRKAEFDMPFSRMIGVRAIGVNTRRDIEGYLEKQIVRAEFVDPHFAQALGDLTYIHPEVGLTRPAESVRGRYWYNLHLVLVVEGRVPIRDLAVIKQVRDSCLAIAEKKGHALSRVAPMPDHLHLALRGNIEQSPLEIAATYLNNLAYRLNQGRIWSRSFYLGTFGEYTTHALRKNN
jgi:REP element-mobilizing transposase RayT